MYQYRAIWHYSETVTSTSVFLLEPSIKKSQTVNLLFWTSKQPVSYAYPRRLLHIFRASPKFRQYSLGRQFVKILRKEKRTDKKFNQLACLCISILLHDDISRYFSPHFLKPFHLNSPTCNQRLQ